MFKLMMLATILFFAGFAFYGETVHVFKVKKQFYDGDTVVLSRWEYVGHHGLTSSPDKAVRAFVKNLNAMDDIQYKTDQSGKYVRSSMGIGWHKYDKTDIDFQFVKTYFWSNPFGL